MKELTTCQKRDGSIMPFEKHRITNAIHKAFKEANEGNRIIALKVTETVVETITRKFKGKTPTVEDIQDIVEMTLMQKGFNRTAKLYILYRQDRFRTRVGV